MNLIVIVLDGFRWNRTGFHKPGKTQTGSPSSRVKENR